MLAECVLVDTESITPIKEALCAKLHDLGYRQTEISRILKISQPMISNYLKNKPSKNVGNSANDILNIIRKENDLSINYVFSKPIKANSACFLASRDRLLSRPRSEAISELEELLKEIKKLNLKDVLPKVKTNIAVAISGAKSKDDVASIPGGLVFIKGKLEHYSPAEFGSSSHLSNLLTEIMKQHGNLNLIMNIKFSEDILRKIRHAKLAHAYLDDKFIPKIQGEVDILIHKGGFGLEPCTYILAENKDQLLSKLKKLL